MSRRILPQVFDFATQNLGKRSSKMKEDWKECKLGEVVEINPTESIKKGAIAKKIGMDILQPYCRSISSFTTEAYSGGAKFRNKDTIMARITPCLENGKTAMVNILDDNEIGFGSTEYIVFRAKDNISDPYFIYYLITSSIIREPAIKSMVGSSGRQRVQTDVVANLSINLPPLATQQKIAAILSSLDDKIELNNKINDNLEQQAQAIFKRFLNNSSKLVKFTDVIDILGGGTPKTNNENYWNGDIPFFTPKDVGNPYCLITEKTITKNGLENCNSKLYPVNTIFVTARGTVGKVCLAGLPMAMNQSCYALKSKDNNQLLAYFYTLEVISSLKYKANGATFDAIVTRDFETETITVLSNTDSEKFTYIVESIYEQILFKQQENIRLTQLRDTLLPKLMNGEIEVEIWNL